MVTWAMFILSTHLWLNRQTFFQKALPFDDLRQESIDDLPDHDPFYCPSSPNASWADRAQCSVYNHSHVALEEHNQAQNLLSY